MTPKTEMVDEPPPILGTWRRVYTFVLCYLVCLIAVFRFFAVHFAP